MEGVDGWMGLGVFVKEYIGIRKNGDFFFFFDLMQERKIGWGEVGGFCIAKRIRVAIGMGLGDEGDEEDKERAVLFRSYWDSEYGGGRM